MALVIEDLGSLAYAEALELQERALEARRRGEAPDRLLLLEHPPVVTLGRSAREENLRLPRAELERRGIGVHEVGRGGDVTWHGPGQLVGYLIVDLAARGAPDVGAHLRGIEAALCDALHALGVPARTIPGWTGVFAAAAALQPRSEPRASGVPRASGAAARSEPQASGVPRASGAAARSEPQASGVPRKLASIGVGVRGWVSWHGFALNVDPDLSGFEAIVPCGLHGIEMSSVARELAGAAPPDLGRRARDAVRAAFASRHP
jgi:lipoyl(octanoyl) transferase